MTESEAKQKGCPHAYIASERTNAALIGTLSGNFVSVATVNRDMSGYSSGSKCLASECMAWLWTDNDETEGFCSASDTNRNYW